MMTTLIYQDRVVCIPPAAEASGGGMTNRTDSDSRHYTESRDMHPAHDGLNY